MSEISPKGILRNVNEDIVEEKPVSDNLYRQEVIKNTRLNAQLHSETSKGDQIRAKIAEAKAKSESHKASHEEHLKWDELNLYKAEQEKSATMKIDEPKTPYEGGFNPEGEYYCDDEDDIPSLELGEGELDGGKSPIHESLNGSEIIKDPSYGKSSETKSDSSASSEDRRRQFEEKRKAHYHLKGKALKHQVPISDDDDDDD